MKENKDKTIQTELASLRLHKHLLSESFTENIHVKYNSESNKKRHVYKSTTILQIYWYVKQSFWGLTDMWYLKF